MTEPTAVHWLRAPEEHDYPAAASYLALLAAPDAVAALVEALRAAPTVTFKAKDVLRAAGLTLLPKDDFHVASDLKKIKAGKGLAPVLLVRGDLTAGVALQVADGYHRVCASYYVSETTDVPCRVAAR